MNIKNIATLHEFISPYILFLLNIAYPFVALIVWAAYVIKFDVTFGSAMLLLLATLGSMIVVRVLIEFLIVLFRIEAKL